MHVEVGSVENSLVTVPRHEQDGVVYDDSSNCKMICMLKTADGLRPAAISHYRHQRREAVRCMRRGLM
jgi:hypothetical protein